MIMHACRGSDPYWLLSKLLLSKPCQPPSISLDQHPSIIRCDSVTDRTTRQHYCVSRGTQTTQSKLQTEPVISSSTSEETPIALPAHTCKATAACVSNTPCHSITAQPDLSAVQTTRVCVMTKTPLRDKQQNQNLEHYPPWICWQARGTQEDAPACSPTHGLTHPVHRFGVLQSPPKPRQGFWGGAQHP